MGIMVFEPCDNISILRPLFQEWKHLCYAANYTMDVDVNICLNTVSQLAKGSNGDVLVLMDNGLPRGFIGLIYQQSHIGCDLIANECCFFVSETARGGGLRLLRAAERLAKHRGCKFIILNASRVAGDADRSGMLYKRTGFEPLEESYIKGLS